MCIRDRNRIIKEFKWIENEHKLVKQLQAGKKLTVLHLLSKVILTEAKRTVRPSLDALKYLIKYLVNLRILNLKETQITSYSA